MNVSESGAFNTVDYKAALPVYEQYSHCDHAPLLDPNSNTTLNCYLDLLDLDLLVAFLKPREYPLVLLVVFLPALLHIKCILLPVKFGGSKMMGSHSLTT